MTVPDHTHTTQEQAIWDALDAGDHDAIDQMRGDATTPPYVPPDPAPEDWTPGPDQWNRDYANATTHYQDAHEIPEDEREEHTVAAVDRENDAAGGEE